MGNATRGQESSERSWGLGKKQKGGVVPLVLRPREREFREAGQALITLLALDGTCNSQRIRRTGPRRSSTPSLCAAVCVQPLSHFPSSSFLMPFWREWARKIFNLATISDWKKNHHRRRDRRVSSPLGPGCSKSHGKSTGSPRRRDTNRPTWLWQVAFLKAILTLHRETLHFDRRQAGMTCPLCPAAFGFASAEKRSAHGETSAVCLFNLQRLPNLACQHRPFVQRTERALPAVDHMHCQLSRPESPMEKIH